MWKAFRDTIQYVFGTYVPPKKNEYKIGYNQMGRKRSSNSDKSDLSSESGANLKEKFRKSKEWKEFRSNT